MASEQFNKIRIGNDRVTIEQTLQNFNRNDHSVLQIIKFIFCGANSIEILCDAVSYLSISIEFFAK